MGLQNGVKCLSTIDNIPIAGFMHLLRYYCEKNDFHSTQPIIDFDMNWLLMNKSKPTDSIKTRVDKVVDILVAFSKCGCVCVPVCDPENRHHSKRASVERRAKNLILDIRVKYARYALAQVNQQLLNGESSPKLVKEKNDLAKVAKKNVRSNIISLDT